MEFLPGLFAAPNCQFHTDAISDSFPGPACRPVSRFTHGAAGTFDINLPLAGPPGIECRRTNGGDGIYAIVFTFRNTLNSVYNTSVTGGAGRVHDSGIGADPHDYIVNLVNVSNLAEHNGHFNFVQDSVGHASNAVNAAMSVLVGDITDNGNVGSADVGGFRGSGRTAGDGGEFPQRRES